MTDRRHHLLSLFVLMYAGAWHGYVIASVPANTRKASVPTVAFLAHVDTAPDCSGKDVKPILHRKYNGSVIRFPDNPGLTLDPATSPELRTALAKTL